MVVNVLIKVLFSKQDKRTNVFTEDNKCVWNRVCLPSVHCCTLAGYVLDSKSRVLSVTFSLIRFTSISTVYT